MNLSDAIRHAEKVAKGCGGECSSDHIQLARWLSELEHSRSRGGISICILTYNVFFYNRLALQKIRELTKLVDYEILIYDNGSDDGSLEWLSKQSDVQLWRGDANSMRHGQGLDFLVKKAKYPICCTLCSDAFPVSPDWIRPAFYLNDETMLAGIDRGWGRELQNYVCPSYLFGWTEWLKKHTFNDEWPKWDTGERMGIDCLAEGKKMKFWKYESLDFDGRFKRKPCDYAGMVWHTWWGGRGQSVKGLAGKEFEAEYHEHVKNMLREQYNLDY